VSEGMSYRDAGVDIRKADRIVRDMRDIVSETWTEGVQEDFGGFAASFVPDWSAYRHPRLVSCTDGVGTKLKLAGTAGRLRGTGVDCVAMVVNDLITSGARPLFFLDYLAANTLESDDVLEIVRGLADGCRRARCALIGGETAEMPGTYADDGYELVGFAVGIAEGDPSLQPREPEAGDLLMALPSSGLHSNGFSLVRRLVLRQGWSLTEKIPPLERPLGEALLRPTRIYAAPVLDLFREGSALVAANITGGGLEDNVRRVLPAHLAPDVDWQSWQVPPVFSLLDEAGGIGHKEMRRTFNMGVGMVVVVPSECRDDALATAGAHGLCSWMVGTVVEGGQK